MWHGWLIKVLELLRGFVWKCTKTKTKRWIQIDWNKRVFMKSARLSFRFLTLSPFSASFSPLLFQVGWSRRHIINIQKMSVWIVGVWSCECVCVFGCVHLSACACEGKTVCACLSVVILHGSVHKSDYHKSTAENRLLIVLWVFPSCFLLKTFPAEQWYCKPMCLM